MSELKTDDASWKQFTQIVAARHRTKQLAYAHAQPGDGLPTTGQARRGDAVLQVRLSLYCSRVTSHLQSLPGAAHKQRVGVPGPSTVPTVPGRVAAGGQRYTLGAGD